MAKAKQKQCQIVLTPSSDDLKASMKARPELPPLSPAILKTLADVIDLILSESTPSELPKSQEQNGQSKAQDFAS